MSIHSVRDEDPTMKFQTCWSSAVKGCWRLAGEGEGRLWGYQRANCVGSNDLKNIPFSFLTFKLTRFPKSSASAPENTCKNQSSRSHCSQCLDSRKLEAVRIQSENESGDKSNNRESDISEPSTRIQREFQFSARISSAWYSSKHGKTSKGTFQNGVCLHETHRP